MRGGRGGERRGEDTHDAVAIVGLGEQLEQLGQLMLTMLARLWPSEGASAADAHDAECAGGRGKEPVQMTFMLVWRTADLQGSECS